MAVDLLTVGIAIFSFIIFLLVQVLTFRRVPPEHLLKALLVCMIVIFGLPLLLTFMLETGKVIKLSCAAWMAIGLMAAVLEGLMCFVYVLCIFGPSETSVRMRLVREIAAFPDGISQQELLDRYNPQSIVKVRLKRLIGSGDILEKDGQYRLGRSRNLFFIFDGIALVIKKWIGP